MIPFALPRDVRDAPLPVAGLIADASQRLAVLPGGSVRSHPLGGHRLLTLWAGAEATFRAGDAEVIAHPEDPVLAPGIISISRFCRTRPASPSLPCALPATPG